MFLSSNKKINVYPCKPQFYYKVGFKGGQKYIAMFAWCNHCDTIKKKQQQQQQKQKQNNNNNNNNKKKKKKKKKTHTHKGNDSVVI